MRKIQLFISFFVWLTLLSCEREVELGSLYVKNTEGIYIKLHQEREFDSNTVLYYQIIKEPNIPITLKKYLHGTDTYEVNTKNFFAECINDIIYLTFHSETEISAIYNLKSNTGYPHLIDDWKESSKIANQLLLELNKTKPELTGRWK